MMAVDTQPAAPPPLLPVFSFTDSDEQYPLTAPSSNETLSSTCSERERRRKQSQPRRSPQRSSGENITSESAGIVFRLLIGTEDTDGPSSSAGQIICREYMKAPSGHLSARQRIAKKVQQRKQRENRELSFGSMVGRQQAFFAEVFDEAGRRRSGRERKQVEIENINFEPPKPRYRRPLIADSDASSDSPDSSDSRPYRKECASCRTRKTPMWRDAPDGTPYCNACGIRFKKYRIRCTHCFYIPRKDEKHMTSCSKCDRHINMNPPR